MLLDLAVFLVEACPSPLVDACCELNYHSVASIGRDFERVDDTNIMMIRLLKRRLAHGAVGCVLEYVVGLFAPPAPLAQYARPGCVQHNITGLVITAR